MTKSMWNEITKFSWMNQEPRWRTEYEQNLDNIKGETGLTEEELEDVLEVLQQYRVLV